MNIGHSPTTRRAGVVMAAGLLLFAACSDDSGDIASTGTTTPAAAETTTTAGDTATTGGEAAADVTVLDVTAADYSYDLGGPPPTLAPGLVQINLTNTSDAEEHQASIVRLNDGVTLDEFAGAAAADPTGAGALALVTGYGGPNLAAPGGGTSTSTQRLDAGDYVMLCFIPSPSDGVPHAAKGMVLPFTVEGDASSATLPEADVAGELGVHDFGFDVPDGFDGQGTFTVANDAEQAHEIGIYALADGATVEDAVGFLSGTAAAGPPPFTPSGGIGPVAGTRGVDSYVTLDLAPGEYMFICFLPDVTSDGAPHFTKGMVQQVSIT